MSDVPWWAFSPSPMTLATYTILALYGAYKLESKTWKQFLHNFCESALVIGLIILPFDTGWQTFQWLKFGFLYTDEIKLVIGVYLRNISIYALCYVSAWKLADKTKKLQLQNSLYFIFPTLILFIMFLMSPDPGWTDWTYPMRFPELSSAYWLFSYLMVLPIRVMKGLAYVSLWKNNFITKR